MITCTTSKVINNYRFTGKIRIILLALQVGSNTINMD